MQAEYSWLARWLLPTVSKLNVLKVPVAPVKYCRQPAGALQGKKFRFKIHLLAKQGLSLSFSLVGRRAGDLRHLDLPLLVREGLAEELKVQGRRRVGLAAEVEVHWKNKYIIREAVVRAKKAEQVGPESLSFRILAE